MTARRLILRLLPLAPAGLALLLLPAACKTGPDYRRPDLDVPTTFKSATTQDAGAPRLLPDWWTLYGDPQLTALEQAAVAYNQDLKAAAARVVQALAATAAVRSQFYPVITLDPSLTWARTPGRSSGGTGGSAGSGTTTTTRIPFDLSYEVDIWGRVRRSVEQSEGQFRAAQFDFVVVLQTLTADVATDYFNLRSLDEQERIFNLNIDLYHHQIELVQTQLNAGLVGPTDLLQAQTQLESIQAQQIDVRRQRADVEHALAILVGRPPADLALAVRPLDLVPPQVPAGLPADLLRQRPDVAEAEQNLLAASAAVGVAKANFYPVVQLTGLAGFESLDIEHTLDWQSRIWSIGPSISVPIFEGGRLNAQLQQAQARYDELLAAYRGAVLVAFREVEDSLTDLHLRTEQGQSQDRAVAAAREYGRLAELQYRQGLTGYLQVIDADRTILTNELTGAEILNQRLASSVLLIKALGGGWQPGAPIAPATQPAAGPR